MATTGNSTNVPGSAQPIPLRRQQESTERSPSELLPIFKVQECLYVPIEMKREPISRLIQALIDFLDHMDPDPDLEPEMGFVGHGTGWRPGEETDDREGGDEREHDDAE